MIWSLFFPERIGSYYLFRKRVVGIEINDQSLIATVVVLRGRSKSIEAIHEVPLSTNTDISPDEKVVQALRSLGHTLPKFDALHYALPSSRVIFKELTLPFIGLRKIKMVVPFEAEPLLPFNLDAGVIDSISTHENVEEKKTDIMLCALKKEALEKYINYFTQAQLRLDKVSVDIFDLYGLYEQVFKDAQEKKAVALLDIGASRTILGLIIQGRLSYVRSFQLGCVSLEKKIPGTVLDAKMKEHLSKLLADILLTVEATLPKIASADTLDLVVLSGMITDVKESNEFVASTLGTPVEQMTGQQILSSRLMSSTVTALPGAALVSLATASSPEKTQEFTLLQEKERQELSQQILYQIITAGIVTLTMFLSFSVYSFLRVRTLKKTYMTAEKEAIAELQKQFKLRPDKTKRLDAANKAAQADLKKQETAWRRISPESRYSYLKYLTELTKCINMKESQLELTNLIIKDDTVKLYGSVPGYPQLNKLQTQLECPLFKRVPKLQDKNFKTEPITLIVNQEEL